VRVAVAGALGRMGREVCSTIDAADDLVLVGGFDRFHAGESLQEHLGLKVPSGLLYDDLAAFYHEANPEVVVDFTVHPTTVDVARQAVEHGASPVVGATGWKPEEIRAL